MQLFLYFIALVAATTARQLQNGPQVLSEKSSSNSANQKIDKRFVTQEFNFYLTPEEIQALRGVKSSQNSVSIESLKQNSDEEQEAFNQQLQNFIAENLKPAPIEEPQVEEPVAPNVFLPREESVYNNQQKNNFVGAYAQLLRDQAKLSGQAQNVQVQNLQVQNVQKNPIQSQEFVQASPNVYILDKEQEEKLLHDQLNKQWNRILDHNRAQLKALSSEQKQNERGNVEQVQAVRQEQQNSNKNNNEKSELEKEIENIWRQHQAFGFENSNLPVEVVKQSDEKDKQEVEKEIEYILRNHQAFEFAKSNVAKERNVQNQGKNVEQSEIERQIQNLYRNQQGYPVEVNKREREERQQQSEVEKQIEFILNSRQTEFVKSDGGANNQKSIEQNQSDVEKQIDSIFRRHQEFELEKSKSTAKEISQSPPILIHKHVTITKHLPVPVVKNVQVSVPTPVLVPVPEPYEVKVPHLYPVPLEVVKHIPVPVIRH
ncbi:unnamed protein product [Danaus chrysippus]|uniref:(African queen) hypothetical protein n=1 Tax=Danaus chrysippus TaxID=151541 RepID=A0A8J2MXD6_9NEOP|nr:unnamed protein product [Danaus chrysippus]